jgi:mannosyltransferase OCH1-like enzyme
VGGPGLSIRRYYIEEMQARIPKQVYQTWKTKELPPKVEALRQWMIHNNPEYTFLLFDDADMDTWMQENTAKDIYECYSQLNVGAAKADLWRYCILYKNGGVYLDIDSIIMEKIDNILKPSDEALVSRERNGGKFLQWLIFFKAGHSVLKGVIEKVIYNILKRSETNIALITGPGPFTDAINEHYIEHMTVYRHLWYVLDNDINSVTTVHSEGIKDCCRFYSTDFGDLARWKHSEAEELYTDMPHWTTIERVFK